MEHTTLKQLPPLKLQKVLIILAFVSLVLLIPSLVFNLFFVYEVVETNSSYTYQLVTTTPSFRQVFAAIYSLAIPTLLLVFLLTYPKKAKCIILFPFLFALLSIYFLINFITNISDTLNNPSAISALVVANLIPVILFSLAAFSALKGLANKVFILIPTVLYISVFSLSLLVNVTSLFKLYIKNGQALYAVTSTLSSLYFIVLFIALLLLGTKNRTPAIIPISAEKEKNTIAKMTPKKALLRLNEDLQIGIFSEEEYQELRAGIIARL